LTLGTINNKSGGQPAPRSVGVVKLNSVLLCTAPLQVVNTQSAVDYLSERDGLSRKLFVILIHPLLGPLVKKLILDIANTFDDVVVLDYSEAYEDMLKQRVTLKPSRISSLITGVGRARSLIKSYQLYTERLGVEILKEIGTVDEIYCRGGCNHLEGFFLRSMGSVKTIIRVDDGHGDYIPVTWKYATINTYEIAHQFRRRLSVSFKLIGAILITGQAGIAKNVFLKPRVKWSDSFSNLSRKNCKQIGRYVHGNIKKLSVFASPYNSDRKILILGSKIPNSRFGFTIEQEVEMYNASIDFIKQRHGVSEDQIWYKHHPRLSQWSWNYKKNKLNSRLFDYEECSLAEVEFCNPNLIAVYSPGSTALIHANVLFNKPSFLIDLSREKSLHPAIYKQYKYVADLVGIPSIVWEGNKILG